MPSARTFGGRASILGCILVAPFLQFVLCGGYSPVRPEALSVAGVLALACLAIAWICRGLAFYASSWILIVLSSAGAVQGLLFPALDLRLPWAALAMGVAVLVPMYCMRATFFRLLVVFTLGSVAVSTVQFAAARVHPAEALAQESQPPGLGHIVYLILDEHIGLAGLRSEIPECRRARNQLEDILASHGFKVYPNAFSNYAATLDSIPSILNFELEARRRQFTRQNSLSGHRATQNALFERWISQGYAIAAYESDYLDFCTTETECATRTVYAANAIGALEPLPIPWNRKAGYLASNYLLSNPIVRGIVNRSAPCLLHLADWGTGPLSVAGIWPERLAEDILRARRKTAFFVHLLTPHKPYVYQRDGTLRDDVEWRDGREWGVADRAGYERLYAHYAEQVEYLDTQLDGFLHQLQADPVYDRSLIVIHGDHGSRLLERRLSEANGYWGAGEDPGAIHGAGTPPAGDLIDAFSTLLAVKAPREKEGRVDGRCSSVLEVMSETFETPGRTLRPGAASEVYLFDAQGRPRAISMAQACREMEGRSK
ncbi:MAG: sulfatase-like hydrolase/transferase [Bryobacteraceae bacterium]